MANYKRGAYIREAPYRFDCSGFVKWLYAVQGIWLPRLAVQQREYGEVVDPKDLVAGDLVFVSNGFDFYRDDRDDGVSHVGMATGEGTVVHAAYEARGVVEVPFGQGAFCPSDRAQFRGARRIVSEDVLVLTIPYDYHRDIETTDDIRWVIVKSIQRQEDTPPASVGTLGELAQMLPSLQERSMRPW